MSSANCCFLTHIQLSKETGKVVCLYSHLFKNFPQFVVMNTVQGLSIVNEAEVDVFLEFFCFLHYQSNVDNLISGSSASLKLSLYIWKFLAHILLKPSLKDFEYYLASVWNECNCIWFETSLTLPFGIGMKTNLFQSCGPYWVFKLLTCWVQHFNSIIF